ncbi:cytochrome P450 alkane hydroxylase [Paraphoma chrysanthemicola]|nr:cytochrome P450 alkane hydroxylase [Paraphoma chrysanthemicola]
MLATFPLLLFTTIIGALIQEVLMRMQDDEHFGERLGCRPAPRLRNQRPWGVDRLEQIFRADSESRLMALFLFHFRQTGNTLEHKFLGTRAFGTIEPANLEAILSAKCRDFGIGSRRHVTLPLFGDGILTQEGDAWKRSRRLLSKHLNHKSYENLEVFQTGVDDLIKGLQGFKGVVDLQPLFFRLTLDTTSTFLFGESMQSLVVPEATGERSFATAFDTAQRWITKRFRLLDLYWLVDGKEPRQACRDVHEFADQLIDNRLIPGRKARNNPAGPCFMEKVASSVSDRKELRGQTINLLAGGRDTTACLLSWTFFLLVRHVPVMERLRAEIALACVADSTLTRDTLRKLPYLQNVLKETLRLYPSIPVNTRTANRTTVLPTGGGLNGTSPVLVPKGSAVAFSVYSMHRRPDLYGMDAELFRPERWTEDMPLQHDPVKSRWGYLPFQGGPRSCPGMDFAMTEAAYTVVRLLKAFHTIQIPADEQVELVGVERQDATLVLKIKAGCKVHVY